MKQVKIPSPGRYRAHMLKYFRSLLQYKDHIAPALNKQFGPDWPDFNAYLCPICLQHLLVVTEHGDLYGSSYFDLDHYPPECVGGKNTVIVCVHCNNMGSEFESVLTDFVRQQAFNSRWPGSTVEAKAVLTYKNDSKLPGSYKVKYVIGEDNITNIDWGNAINQPFVIEWMNNLDKNNNDWTIDLTVENPDYNKVSRALLKAAYLYCFSLWGYEFAFSDNATKMRMVFEGKSEYPAVVNGCHFLQHEKNIPVGVDFINKPESLKNLVVNIPLQLKEGGFICYAGIIIPKPTESGWEDLVNLKLTGIEVEIRDLAPYDINHQLNGYSYAWEQVNNGLVVELPTAL
jgi:hypothetical protein